MVRLASDATEKPDDRIDTEDLDGHSEAEELRDALERLQAVRLEISG